MICSSIGATTVEATASALAPGYWPDTLMTGGAISGYCAIGTEQVRKFVLVVGADNSAVAKYVTLGPVVEDNLRIVREGLNANDRVIVNGLMRVRPGMVVDPKPLETK